MDGIVLWGTKTEHDDITLVTGNLFAPVLQWRLKIDASPFCDPVRIKWV